MYGHKIILTLLSERFRAMLGGEFMESRQSEIVIEDVRHSVFLRMLEYMYTGNIRYGWYGLKVVVVGSRWWSGGDDRQVMIGR